jgi:hypothetical protein
MNYFVLLAVLKMEAEFVSEPSVLPCRLFFSNIATAPSGPGTPNYRGFTITLRHTQDSSGRVISPTQRPLTTHNTHNTQTSIPSALFEPAVPASERPQTHALDRAATEIGCHVDYSQVRRSQSEQRLLRGRRNYSDNKR